MNKNKGFTVVTLIASLTILAILMILAVPKILDAIERADMNAYKDSVELMVHTAKLQYDNDNMLKPKEIPQDGIVYEYENNRQVNINDVGELKFSGDKPLSGTITLTKDKKVIVSELVSKNGKWCAIKEENKKTPTVGKVSELECTVEEAKIEIVDKVPCELETSEETINGTKINVYYIDSESDLYALSLNVSGGKDYLGEKVVLRNNLDMGKYTNSEIQTQCKNMTVTGFEPIGNKTHPFKGTFDGDFNTISNLAIDMTNPTQNQKDRGFSSDYVGLFGYINQSTIYGLKLDNANINGASYVGSLIGSTSVPNSIYGIIIENSKITGTKDYTGGLVGCLSGKTNYVKEIMIDNIEITGNSYIAGISGYTYGVEISNVLFKSGKINKLSTDEMFGFCVQTEMNSIIIENLEIESNSSKITKVYHSMNDEFLFDEDALGDISFYEATGLDTYIGGDNDNDDYYFDYESDASRNVVLKRIKEEPINFTLSGSGTESDPYIIDSEKKWKEATTKLSAVYKLTKDLNFSNNKYYMMGSLNNTFKGIMNGNDKKISNVIINSYSANNVGIFGNINGATIYGLNLEHLKISARENAGGLVGNIETNNTIYAITINDIEMLGVKQSIGGLAGNISANSSQKNIIKEILIDNIKIDGRDFVGGAIGDMYYGGDINNILVKNGTISSKGYIGLLYGHTKSTTVKNSIVENIQATTVCELYNTCSKYYTSTANKSYSSEKSKINGVKSSKAFSSGYIDNLNYYSENVETAYQGDTNKTGYFFDYDDSHNGKVWLVKAYTSTASSTLNVDTSLTVTYTNPSCSEQTVPTCTLKSMQILTNGFTPLVECTDDTQIESFRSYFDSRTEKAADTYEQIGDSKSNITWLNNNKKIIYNGTWRETNRVGPWPKSGVCYYFRYGARDTCGNYSTYVSDSCFNY